MDTQLNQHEAWLASTARALVVGNRRVNAEDLKQEGWVAMWEAQDKAQTQPSPESYLKRTARNRMIDVMRHEGYFVKGGRPVTRQEVPADTTLSHVFDDLTTLLNLDAIELRIHEEEIWAAIHSLSQTRTQYVLLRFWRGYTDGEACRYLGYQGKSIWQSIKGQLRVKLAHLVEV